MNAFRNTVWLIALMLISTLAAGTQACPFCDGEKGPTLVLQIEEAQMVLYGHFEKARTTNTGLDQGETDFVIENVLKSHDLVKGKKMITLPRYVVDSKSKFVIFCDVYQGKIDAYKGTQLTKSSEMLKYVEGILKRKAQTQPERLRFAFEFLQSSEVEVALDAYREFARADYRDYKDMAKTLDPKVISGWLKDPKTPPFRYGLYASLLGHCGKEEHAKLLMEMIQDTEKQKGSGLHGLMAAYTMLEPDKGWTFLKDLVRDPEKPFLFRYQGLQTMRFLWECRPDLVHKDDKSARDEIVKGVAGVMQVTDMADFAIEDMRKWKRWEYCDSIIDLFGQKKYNAPIIRKSILRYALQCPSPRAVAFVKEQTTRDREWVEETRELLNLETPAAATTPTK